MLSTNTAAYFALPVRLPPGAGRWRMQAEIPSYTGTALYDYMDGPAEIYRAHDYARAWVARYAVKAMPEIKFELFDMGSADNALGVFTHNRQGKEAGVGQGSEYQGNVLLFWQARYFVCISAFSEAEEVKKAVFELGKLSVPALGGPAPLPPIFQYLPENGLAENSVRYFSRPACLQYHHYMKPVEMFGLDGRARALFAEYPDAPYAASLLLILYPDELTSKITARRIEKECREPYALDRKGKLLAMVLGAENEKRARALLKHVQEKTKGKP
jgi:hypothetical protein